MLASNAPDIDILSAVRGSLSYLHYHRHWTHSLLAMPLMALLPVVLVRFVGRRPVAWVNAFLASLIAVASHLLLDLTNIYGVRLLLPFSSDWQRLDLTTVIDVWIWAVMLLAVAGPFIARLVGSEIASSPARLPHHGRGFAWFALIFLLLYNGGRSVLHARAVAILDSRLYQGLQPMRVSALPHQANPFRWNGLIETREFWASADVNLLGEFDPTEAGVLHKAGQEPAIDAARETPTFQAFLKFSQAPLWQVTPISEPENGRLVQVFDLRFGNPMSPGFMVSAIVNGRLQVIDEIFRFRARPR